MSTEEGLAIVKAARGHRQQVLDRLDCSHLVHEIYRRAGFSYSYASSFELYAGIENFVRVNQPQRGDLVVWRGHVGIVVEPAMRAFYSSVRLGLRMEFYDAPEWRRRGLARFYRYAVRDAGSSAMTIAQSRLPDLTTADAIGPAAAVGDNRERAPGTATRASNARSVSSGPTPVAAISAPRAAKVGWPLSILVATSKDKPTNEEIAEAVSELTSAAAGALRGRDLLKLERPVVIVDQMDVERVEIKGKRGWAQIRTDSRLSIAGERIDLKRSREKRRWELLRTGAGWTVVAPRERAYVARDVAIRILAAQLVSLTQDVQATTDPGRTERQQAQIVRMLSALFEGM